ncbi:MAG: amidohydrolase family protein [Betaproteobacteria bacterium]|nr:amidohydrolase family protein [Betaproteobacteria bacterium]
MDPHTPDTAPGERPFSPTPGPSSAPRTVVPRGATDCHFHVFGPHARYPLSPARAYDPEEASIAAYQAMARTIGIERMVIVQASPYGMDNRCVLDAIGPLGSDVTRGVAVVDGDVTDAELARMHEAGIRGIRFNTLSGGTRLEHLDLLARRIAPLGWHIQIWATAKMLRELSDRLVRLPVEIVIDHLGLVSPAGGTTDPDYRALLALLGSGRAWIKLCGYRASVAGPPYEDVAELARGIIAAAPDRCVWGTDWPHPMLGGNAMPDDGQLVDALARWAETPEALERILVHNPARLYGFPA